MPKDAIFFIVNRVTIEYSVFRKNRNKHRIIQVRCKIHFRNPDFKYYDLRVYISYLERKMHPKLSL